MIRVLIADDHALIREGLKRILDASGGEFEVDVAVDGHDALAHTAEREYDVVLLDIGMPGIDGMETLKQMKRDRPEARVLMLTMYSEAQYATRALRAGASGYLTKDRAPEEMVEAIRKVSAGERYITSTLAEKLAGELVRGVDRPTHELLSAREFQVLRAIAGGFSVSQIAEKLSLSAKTVSTYRARIVQKTGMASNAEFTQYAIHNGLVE